MAQERDLAMVQIGLAKQLLSLTNLASLARQVGVELVDRAADDLELVQDEVRRVEAVGLVERHSGY